MWLCMSDWLTDEELDRISQFVETPAYARRPEMLLPDSDDE